MVESRTQQFFIVGTGRCGSTLLSNLLHDFSHGLSLSEFFTVLGGPRLFTTETIDSRQMWELLSRPNEDVVGLLEHASNIPEILYSESDWSQMEDATRLAPLMLIPLPHMSSYPIELYSQLRLFVLGLPDGPISMFCTRIFKWLQHHHRKQYWLERSGGSVEYLGQLVTHWPQAKFIHLIRDGLECALSMSSHPFFRLRVSRLLGKDPTMPVNQALASDIPIDRFGAYWSALVIKGTSTLKQLPKEQVLHIHYEELILRPQAILVRLFRFLEEQAPSPERLSQMRALIRPSKTRSDQLEKPLRETLSEVCGPGKRALERVLLHSH